MIPIISAYIPSVNKKKLIENPYRIREVANNWDCFKLMDIFLIIKQQCGNHNHLSLLFTHKAK